MWVRGTALLLFLLALRTTDSRPLHEREVPELEDAVERRSVSTESYVGETTYSYQIMNEGHIPLRDCTALRDEAKPDALQSGLYKIYPGDNEGEFTAFCDMQLYDLDGGWTVIQRRVSGDISFDRTWSEYENGFGNLNGNFWLGLRKIQRITDMPGAKYELFIGLQDKDGQLFYALYDDFGLHQDTYQIMLGKYLGGTKDTDGLDYVRKNAPQFSTKDRDNDFFNGNCAKEHKGGWWYDSCHDSNLNGDYSNSANHYNGGIHWSTWHAEGDSAVSSIMAVRKLKTD